MSSHSVHVDLEIIKQELEQSSEENCENNSPDIKFEVTEIKVEECVEEIEESVEKEKFQINIKQVHNEVIESIEAQSTLQQDDNDDISVESRSQEDFAAKSSNQCHLCSKTLPSHLYKKHMFNHSRVKKICCVKCDALYLNKKSFSSHMLSKHADTIILQCLLCSRKFCDVSLLEFHMVIHSSETFSCDFCKENFDYKSLLTIHMRKHIGGKVYICDKCSKEFESPTALKHHKAIHTGQKDFICSLCKVGFSRRSKLNRHIRQNTHSKELKCNLLEKKIC